eukprot:1345279-Prymnesium_polylepis.2
MHVIESSALAFGMMQHTTGHAGRHGAPSGQAGTYPLVGGETQARKIGGSSRSTAYNSVANTKHATRQPHII